MKSLLSRIRNKPIKLRQRALTNGTTDWVAECTCGWKTPWFSSGTKFAAQSDAKDHRKWHKMTGKPWK